MKKIKLSIVIPCYNEGFRIAQTVKTVKEFLSNKGYSWEIILVNDGSKDNTLEKAKQISDVTLITYDINRGKGYALRQGVAKSQGEYICLSDADLSTPISEIDKFIERIDEFDVIIGSRALQKEKVKSIWYRKLLGEIGNVLIRMMLKVPYKDTQCGFKLLKSSTVKEIFLSTNFDRWSYDFEFIHLLEQKKMKIFEMPVLWKATGDTRVKPGDYFRTFRDLLSIVTRKS